MRRSVRNRGMARMRDATVGDALRGLTTGVIASLVAGVGTAVVTGIVAAPAASAEEPLQLDESITDRSGALGDRAEEVQAEIDQLFSDHRLRLWVVYVDDFSDYGEVEWADLTAVENEFGLNDVLLAVATDTGNYALSVDREYELTDEELDEIDTVAVEPALAERDWAGAAIGAADAFAAVRSGEEVVTPSITPGEPEPADDDSAAPWIIGGIAVVVAAVAVAGLVLYLRRRSAPSEDQAGALSEDQHQPWSQSGDHTETTDSAADGEGPEKPE